MGYEVSLFWVFFLFQVQREKVIQFITTHSVPVHVILEMSYIQTADEKLFNSLSEWVNYLTQSVFLIRSIIEFSAQDPYMDIA